MKVICLSSAGMAQADRPGTTEPLETVTPVGSGVLQVRHNWRASFPGKVKEKPFTS